MHATPQSILALIPNWIGDAAMCTPALRALHRRFPEAVVSVAGRASACALLNGLPWVHERIAIPARPSPAVLMSLSRRLRPYARDIVVVFPHSFRSALLAALTGARCRVGQRRNGRSWLLTHRAAPHRRDGRIEPIYMAQEYLDLVRVLGCEDDGAGLELAVDPSVQERIHARLAGSGPLIGLAPGAAFGPSKLWPPERYAQTAERLTAQLGARCVLLTGPGEEATRDAVIAATKAPLLRADDGKPTLETLKAAVSALDLLICNDSGARHVAVAFHIPTLCLMGPTSPRYSEGPYERGRVLRVEVDCGPCQKPICTTDHRCLTRIETDEVVAAAREILLKS